jgi:hypothetical protein
MRHTIRIKRAGRLLLAIFTAVTVAGCNGNGDGTTPSSSEEGETPHAMRASVGDPVEADRQAAIATTAERIDHAVAARGGSWNAWKDCTEPFRADLVRITRGKWPWPANKNFRFLGRSARLLMLESWEGRPPQQRPWETIIDLNQQLRSRGIDLVFMPIPDKIATYPDYISEKTPEDRAVSWQARRVLRKLCREGVEVIDLYPDFRAARRRLGEDKPLFYDRDSHWRNRAAVLAADRIAQRLKRYEPVKAALVDGTPYEARPFHRSKGESKEDRVKRVYRRDNGKPYRDVLDSPVVVTGDSFSMYNMHLNGHLSAHVARFIGMPVTFVAREGLAQAVPVELASRQKRENFLAGRCVIVWTVRGRSLVEKKWRPAELARKPDKPAGKAVRGLRARGKVLAVSPGPDADSEYADYVMKIHLKDLRDADGWGPLRDGQAVVRAVAMEDHQILPAAAIEPGQTISLKLTTWSAMEPTWGRTNTGSLADTKAETDLPQFWGELTDE